MANVRIKDITTTASAPNEDDYLAIDGATAGTRKISAADLGGDALTTDIKDALLQIASKVAYIDEHGQDYYDDLHDALYPPAPPATLLSISAVYTQSGTVYDTDTLDSLKPDLVVTGNYDDGTTRAITTYTLSGELVEGTSTITVSYGGLTDTFDVTVTHQIVIDYTLDALSGISWNDGYTYNQSTGVKTSGTGEHCSDKFMAQDCLYSILPERPYNYRAFFLWDSEDNYFGYDQINGNVSFPIVQLNPEHYYAVKAYTTGTFDSSIMTVLPVDNREAAVDTFTLNLADYVESFTWANSAAEMDATSILSQYGLSTSNYLTSVNHLEVIGADAMLIYLGATGGGMKFKGFTVALGVYSNKLLLTVKDSNNTSLAALTQYISEHDIKLKIN